MKTPLHEIGKLHAPGDGLLIILTAYVYVVSDHTLLTVTDKPRSCRAAEVYTSLVL